MVATTVFDTIGVTLQIKVPTNARASRSTSTSTRASGPSTSAPTFNDSFVAWLQSAAWLGNGGDLNIAFDSMGNAVSVNNALLQPLHAEHADRLRRDTGRAGTAACTAGPNELQGTGFYNLGTYCTSQRTGGGATGWLTTKAPVKGGETITLQLIIWDTGDANWDSSVLLDNLTWYGATQVVKTAPSP